MAVGPPPSAPKLRTPDLSLIPTSSAALKAKEASLIQQQKYLGDQYRPQRQMTAIDTQRSLTDQGLFDRANVTERVGADGRTAYKVEGMGEGQASRNQKFRSLGADAVRGVSGSESKRKLTAGLDSLKNQRQGQLRGQQNQQTTSLLSQAAAARDISGQIGQTKGEQTDFEANALVQKNQLDAQAFNAQLQADAQAAQAKHQYDMTMEGQRIQQEQFDASQAQSHSQWYINFLNSTGNANQRHHAARLAGTAP